MEIYRIIVGTAGHIDHGKSSLVRALTGIDPDRLIEEKERGMTIDLGFAPWSLPDGRRVGLVDVPGHERFVKNMVAGATGIDLVVLVVAADDGVMPQTREHLEIMTLLGIERGLIALTKIDLVDPELVAMASEDVRALVRGTFLESAPILPLSTHTGAGLEAFQAALARAIESVPPRRIEGPFRMPIQRVFSASGFGTIATGVPISGSLAIGDRAQVLPLGRVGRVRGLQAYKEKVESVAAGHSSAVNLSDLDYRELHRGMVLCAPDAFEAGDMFEARFALGRNVPWPLKHLSEVRLHTGTAEVLGQVALLEGNTLEPGAETFVQLRLEEPVCAVAGDRFILRLASPMITLGGGVLLARSGFRIKRSRAGVVERLQQAEAALEDRDEALMLALDASRDGALSEAELARELGWSEEEVRQRLASGVAEGKAVAVVGGWLSAGRIAPVEAELEAALAAYYRRHASRLWMDLRDLRAATKAPAALLEAAIERLCKGGRLERRGTEVRDASRVVQLEPKLAARCEELGAALAVDAFQPPDPAAFGAERGWRQSEVAEALKTLQDLGRARIVNAELAFSAEAIERAAAEIRTNIQRHGELLIPELRDALGTSRKFLIPLLDYFDRTGLTIRQGARRILKSS
ncbi:MAG: selenocysteine-specific translation elongation factor [Planctomycetes bacterium]|nr:selenocysteine-specific translation elongation factor [Planctomycetota bacterium]